MPVLTSFTDSGKVEFGSFIQIDPGCRLKLEKGTCNDFYESLRLDSKKHNCFVCCPRGYAVFFSMSPLGSRIYPCLRCKGVFIKKTKKHNDFLYNPALEETQLHELINDDIKNRIVEKKFKEAQDYISTLSHDVKNLTAQIKEHCDAIFLTHSSLEENEYIEHDEAEKIFTRLRTIFLSSSMILARFTMYDFGVSPETFIAGDRFPCNVYKKFDKIKRIFYNYLKKHIRIHLEGNSFKSINAFSCFEFIPLLLLENAIKYAQENDEITVKFQDSDSYLTVEIISFGPYCEPEELNRIWEKDFRGKHAKKVSEGHGLGLFFVKQIATLHNIEIFASSSKQTKFINNIPYSPFNIVLKFSGVFDS